MLDAEVPVVGQRALLIGDETGCGRPGVGALRRSLRGVRGDSAPSEETSLIKSGHIDGGTQLRRETERSQVVIENIVGPAEARPDGCLAACSR